MFAGPDEGGSSSSAAAEAAASPAARKAAELERQLADWREVKQRGRAVRAAPASLDEGLLSFSLPHSRLYR